MPLKLSNLIFSFTIFGFLSTIWWFKFESSLCYVLEFFAKLLVLYSWWLDNVFILLKEAVKVGDDEIKLGDEHSNLLRRGLAII